MYLEHIKLTYILCGYWRKYLYEKCWAQSLALKAVSPLGTYPLTSGLKGKRSDREQLVGNVSNGKKDKK